MTKWLVRRFVAKPDELGSPATHAAYGKLAGWTGIVCNLVLFCGKLAAGLLSGSVAIVGDAVNNLSDMAGSIITLLGFKLASRPADKEHPFGHARFEYIAGLAVAVIVFLIGIELGKSSLDKIISPTYVKYSALSFIVLVASILLKCWMAIFNRGIGRRIGSTVLEAAYADSRNDVVATTAVLAAAVIARFTGLALDGWMGMAVAAFILYSGVLLLKETMSPLLGEAPDAKLVKYVGDKICSYPGVLGTHDLIVHDYGPGRRFASAHVEMSSDDDVLLSHDTIDNIERDFLKDDNLHLIIHYDPIVTGDEAVNSARTKAAQAVVNIDKRLTIHDFRMIEGPTHMNYIFDVLVPPDLGMPEEELIQRIERALQTGDKPVQVVVTLDYSYASIPAVINGEDDVK